MLKFEGVEYRNLQEQVLKNKDDIENIRHSGNLAELGIKVVNAETPLASPAELPNAEEYAGSYGDAYIVGQAAPFELYVYSRSSDETVKGFWFDWGELNAPSVVPGPIGPQGEQGKTGTRGSLWYSQTGAPTITEGVNNNDQAVNGSNGDLYQFVNGVWQLVGNIRGPQGLQGIQGIQGIQGLVGPVGPQGPKGEAADLVQILGTLENVGQLPDPSSVARNSAYLVDVAGTEHIYLIIGDESNDENPLLWHDAGAFAGGTNVSVDGVKQSQIDLGEVKVNPSFKPGEGTQVSNEGNQSMTFTNMEVSGVTVNGQAATPGTADIVLPINGNGAVMLVPEQNGNTARLQFTEAAEIEIQSRVDNYTPPTVEITAPTTSTQGSFTQEEIDLLMRDMSEIYFNNERYIKQDNEHQSGYLVFTHVGYLNTEDFKIKTITVVLSNRAWILSEIAVPDSSKVMVFDPTIVNDDLDNYYTEMKRYSVNYVAPNLPVAQVSMLEVYPIQSQYVLQKVTVLSINNYGEVYYRLRIRSRWGSWKKQQFACVRHIIQFSNDAQLSLVYVSIEAILSAKKNVDVDKAFTNFEEFRAAMGSFTEWRPCTGYYRTSTTSTSSLVIAYRLGSASAPIQIRTWNPTGGIGSQSLTLSGYVFSDTISIV